ncbi:MAG TPA: helix-turn-helix transcriptional regulator [Nocardioides sp.]
MSEVGQFGEMLMRLRKARGLSQEGLAARAGLSDGYVSQLETGSRGRRIGRDAVLALAQALRLDDDDYAAFLTAAGIGPGEPRVGRERFIDVVTRDPLLRSDQKQVMVDLYAIFVGRMGA